LSAAQHPGLREIDQASAFLLMDLIFPKTPSEGSIDLIGFTHEKLKP
jgi:hypothetical protein